MFVFLAGSSTNSMISSVATSINFGPSVESADGIESHKDTNSISRYSDGGSTASLASCPDWKMIKSKATDDHLSHSTVSLESDSSKRRGDKSTLLSDTSQDSLPSDNIGGEITYHRYYHVFREGELDQLIEKYVENLHIISSYYDHASWCIIAEKVQVWTIWPVGNKNQRQSSTMYINVLFIYRRTCRTFLQVKVETVFLVAQNWRYNSFPPLSMASRSIRSRFLYCN